MNTLNKGDVAELTIALRLIKLGKIVLKPLTSGCRYDLLLDDGHGNFSRVQCKNGRLKDGFLAFNVCSVNKETLARKSYQGEVEYFGVYCSELDKCYLVPISAISSKTEARLRIVPSKTNQQVLNAADYEI